MDAITKIYGERLERCLSVNAQMNNGQVSNLLKRFQTLASHASPEKAFRQILGDYGNEDVETAVAGIKDEIQKVLERASKEHPGIDTNPVSRIKKYIRQYNEKIGKLQIELNIDEKTLQSLAPHQREALEEARKDRTSLVSLKVPAWAREKKGEKEFTATATHQGQKAKLEISVKY